MDYSILIFVVVSVFLKKNTFEFIHTSIVDIEMYTRKNAFRFMNHNQNRSIKVTDQKLVEEIF